MPLLDSLSESDRFSAFGRDFRLRDFMRIRTFRAVGRLTGPPLTPPHEKAARNSFGRLFQEGVAARLPLFFLGGYQMITRSSSGMNIAPSVMPKAS